MKLTTPMAKALRRAASRQGGNFCPVVGVHANAETNLLDALDRRGLIAWDVSANLNGMIERAKFCEAVRESVDNQEALIGRLIDERNAILRAAGGKVTATKEQHRPSSHWSHQSHKDGSETYQIDV